MSAPKDTLAFSGFPGWSLGEDSIFVFEKGMFLGRQLAAEHLMLCKFNPDSVVTFPEQTDADGGNIFGNFGRFIMRNKYVAWCCHDGNIENYRLRMYNIETMECDFETQLPRFVLLQHIEPQEGPDDNILFYVVGMPGVVHFVEVMFNEEEVPVGLLKRPDLTWEGTPDHRSRYDVGKLVRKGVRQIGTKIYTQTRTGLTVADLQYITDAKYDDSRCIIHGNRIFCIDDTGVLSCYSMSLQRREWAIETAVTGAVTPAVFGNLVVCASLLDGGLEVIDWRKQVKLARYAISGVREMRFVGQKLWVFSDARAPSPRALQLEI